MNNSLPCSFVYFAGEPLGVPVLEKLLAHNLIPSLIVCNPDRPHGRGRTLTPPAVKQAAQTHNIPIWQPEDLKDRATVTAQLAASDLFVVVAYNRILPTWLIELPRYQTINLHPSLLPKLRGANPIRTAILEDRREDIGVSIIQLDTKMDHGPLLAQAAVTIADEKWPIPGRELDALLADRGGALLAQTIPEYVAGRITPHAQNHKEATYTKKMTKADGELPLDPYHLPTGETAYRMLLKIRAYDGWPGTYFLYNGSRIVIKEAECTENGTLRLVRITPEGKSEMAFADYFPDAEV